MSRPLRVALDVAPTRLGRAGVARSISELAEALEQRDDLDVVRIGAGSSPAHRSPRRRALALRHDLAWHPRGARRRAAALEADVLHSPLPRGPLTRGTPPVVVTVHDLAIIRHPATMNGWNRRYTRRTLQRIIAAADALVAVSRDTADDLAAYAPAAADRIHVVENGVSPFWSAVDATPPPFGGPYVLFVGTPEPRKNLGRLVAAMRNRRAAGAQETLVLAGTDGWGSEEVAREPWIVSLGRVDDLLLRRLYRHAVALVIPSLHEGSGLPALEAMAAGTPVVAAAAGALPETCGDAAILVDPFQVRSIAGGIDQALTERDALIERGRRRVEDRTWERTAAGYAAVYRTLV